MALTKIVSEGIKDSEVKNADMADDAVGVAELSATGTASSSTFLRGDNSWQTISTTPEGTSVLSTGETGTTKFLRVDGDNSCSWQVPPDTNTTYSVGDGGLTTNDFTNADHTKLDGIAASANNYVHPNHSGDVTSSADGATTIADNAVTLAKMAGLARGKLIVGDASGDPAALAAGSDNHVLTMDANGDCGWEAAAASGMPTTGGTFTGDVTFDNQQNAGKDVRWDESANALEFDDNTKLNLGTGDDISIYFDGTDGHIKQPAGAMWTESASWVITSANGGENIARFDQNGACKLYYDNALKVETISTGLNVTGGIRLGGNNAVNELDDYEEGTWTITANNSVTLTSGYDTGSYIKVGHLVTCHGEIQIDSSNSGANMQINLPFTSINGLTEQSEKTCGPLRFYSWNSTTGSGTNMDGAAGVISHIGNGTAILVFKINRNNAATADLVASGGGYCTFSITYRTA